MIDDLLHNESIMFIIIDNFMSAFAVMIESFYLEKQDRKAQW